jgi:hypothetical protein
MVPVSVVSPWRFWIVGVPPIVGGFAELKLANGFENTFVPDALS